MKTSALPWYVWLAVAFVFGAGGIAGKEHLEASANPTYLVAILTAAACLLCLVFFLIGLRGLIKATAKD